MNRNKIIEVALLGLSIIIPIVIATISINLYPDSALTTAIIVICAASVIVCIANIIGVLVS